MASSGVIPESNGAVASTNGHSESSFTANLDNYSFPTDRLQPLQFSTKIPLVLIACGSFSPITYLHLRMFEMVGDYIKDNADQFEVIGGYLSPVSDAYQKKGLEKAAHRLEMVRRAVSSSTWIDLDPYEALRPTYTPTAEILDHCHKELNKYGGAKAPDGTSKEIRVALLAGADLLSTMTTPGVWSDEDLDRILGSSSKGLAGAFIVERAGTDTAAALDQLQRWKENIYVIPQTIQNDVSSTKIRNFLKNEWSVRYLLDPLVIQYIQTNKLYEYNDAPKARRSGEIGRTAVRHP